MWLVIALKLVKVTGKYLSEALILSSTNPQCDDRLFIELHTSSIHANSKLELGENMLCTEIVSDIEIYWMFFCMIIKNMIYVIKKEKNMISPLAVRLRQKSLQVFLEVQGFPLCWLFWHSEQFLYTTCSPHVLQKEECLTKIYLYFRLNYLISYQITVCQKLLRSILPQYIPCVWEFCELRILLSHAAHMPCHSMCMLCQTGV